MNAPHPPPAHAAASRSALNASARDTAGWGAAFDSAGQRGVFVLRRLGRPDSAGGPHDVYDRDAYPLAASDPVRARRPYLPASTFKIPNSLLAFELGVVRDEQQWFPKTWPDASIAAWNRAYTFAGALAASVVPIYQIVARQVGEARYRTWLRRLDYGNADPSGGVDHFWLDGALRTSAVQQVDFLARLAARRLPLSDRSQLLVRGMMLREAGATCAVYAKTGLVGPGSVRPVPADARVGWYVGWVETEGAHWAFALNVDAERPGAAAARVPLAKALPARAGVDAAGSPPSPTITARCPRARG